MSGWRDYQEQAAIFFRGLGLTTTTDERITGARGTHDVDVAVRGETAGIKQLWIVECKKWKTRVGKLHIAALAEITQDIGADRGILLSETGFQAGAIRMARSSNITLSSIVDLKANSEAESIQLGLIQLRKRLSELRDNVKMLTLFKALRNLPPDRYSSIDHLVPGLDMRLALSLADQATTIESTLTATEAGQYPYGHTPSEQLAELTIMITRFENGLGELAWSMREAGENHS